MPDEHSTDTASTDEGDHDDAPLGVLVCQDGRPVAALGLAAAPAAQAALLAAMAAAGNRSLFDARLPAGPAVGVTLSSQGTGVAIVRLARGDSSTLLDFVAAVPFAFSILEQILNDPYQGITVADHHGTIRYISPVHEKFLGLPLGGGIGLPAEQAIPNSRLHAVVQSGKAEIGKLQRLGGGVTRVVNRRPVRQHGRVVGAVGQVMFRDTQAVTEMATEMNQLRSQLEAYRRELDDLRESRDAAAGLVGDSQAMQRLRHEISTVARLDVPVLILGESGTGKELVARALHRLGRPQGTLVSLNLAALPAGLIESELFGHAAGAYTGSARQGRPGRFEQADGGTLFLDEVGDIPADVQIKLLRVLEDRVVERLGSQSARPLDFRLVSATHRDVDALVHSGALRHDLFYRIGGVTLHLPPLRERLEDLPALLLHFVAAFCRRHGRPLPAIDGDVAPYLAEQPWPGNVRQLRHRIEEALVFAPPDRLTLQAVARGAGRVDGALVSPAAGAAPLAAGPTAGPASSPSLASRSAPNSALNSTGAAPPPAQSLKDHECAAARAALQACGGNKQQAAQRLGISRTYLYKLLG